MTENIFGWLILGALVILILLAIFGKRRVASGPSSCPSKDPAGSELSRFFAGVDEGVERGLLQMGKRPDSISHDTSRKQETPRQYYSSAQTKAPVKKKVVRTIPAPANKTLLLSFKGRKAIILGFLILSSLGTYAGNVWAQQILLGPDGQPVRQPFYQTQSFPQTQDSTTVQNVSAPQILTEPNGQPIRQPIYQTPSFVQTQANTGTCLKWIVLAVLIIAGLGVYWAQKKEMVFFNDRTDMWVSISAVVLEGLLFFFNNSLLVISGAGGIIAYHFYCAYKYNSGNIAGAFIMAVSRIVMGVVIPFLALFIFLSGASRQKDESEGAFTIRSAVHAAAKIAMLAGLFIFLSSLVNGEQVRNARGEANSSENSFSRSSSNRQSSYEKQSYSKEKASFNESFYSKKQSSSNKQSSSGTSSKDQSSSNKKENFKTASQEEPSDYDILGVPKTASFKDIQRAYRKMMLKTHPDRMAGMGAKCRQMAEEECKKINAAFDRIRKARNYAFA